MRRSPIAGNWLKVLIILTFFQLFIPAIRAEVYPGAAVADQPTALHQAVIQGDIPAVRKLIRQAEVNEVNKEGDTALHLACRGNQPAIVELLVANGANLNIKNNFGESPLFEVSINGNLELTKFLLAKGAALEVKNRYGRTALFAAMANGHRAIVDLLIERGADLYTIDSAGKTVLFTTVESERLELAALCLDKGVELHCPDKAGNTVLHEACLYGKVAVAEWLISKGADVNARNRAGETPLFSTCQSNSENIPLANLLVGKGAVVDVKDYSGNTLLLTACLNQKKALTKLLLDLGADFKQAGPDGMTVIQFVSESGWTDLLQLLTAKGAKQPVAKKEPIKITKVYTQIENIHSTYWKEQTDSDASSLYYNFFIYIADLKQNLPRITDVSVYSKYGLVQTFDLKTDICWEEGCIGNLNRVMDYYVSQSGTLVLTEGFRVEVKTNDGNTAISFFDLPDPGTIKEVGAQYLYCESYRGPITADFKAALKLGQIKEVRRQQNGLDIYFTIDDPRVFSGCIWLMDQERNFLAVTDYFVEYLTGKLALALNDGKGIRGDNQPNFYRLDFSNLKLEEGHHFSEIKYVMLYLTDGKQFLQNPKFLGLSTNSSFSGIYPIDLAKESVK